MLKRSLRLVHLAIMAAVLGLLLTGCGGPTGPAAQLIKQYPWLGALGIAFVKGLLERFGYDLPDLLAAAAAALAD